MKNSYIVSLTALVAGLALGGCDTKDSSGTTRSGSNTAKPPDNTANNRGDQNVERKTPLDQKENKADINITAEIRRAIMDDKSMSMYAENVKIITENGVVTLRGVVKTQAEKDGIEAKAKATAGVTRVDNQIEVKAG